MCGLPGGRSKPGPQPPAQGPNAPPPELTEYQTTTRPQHTRHLADCGGGIRDKAQNGDGGHHVEAGVGERQPLDLPLQKRHFEARSHSASTCGSRLRG